MEKIETNLWAAPPTRLNLLGVRLLLRLGVTSCQSNADLQSWLLLGIDVYVMCQEISRSIEHHKTIWADALENEKVEPHQKVITG